MHLDAVKEKLGPLPVWAWAGIIVGGGVVFLWWRSHSSSAAADSTDDSSALDAGSDAGDGTSSDGFNGGWDGSGIEAPVNTPPATSTTGGGSATKTGPGGIAYNSQPYSRQAKNPGTGDLTIVSGMGHWVKPNALSKKYNWVAGPVPASGIHAKLSKPGPALVYPGYSQNDAYEATRAHPEKLAGKSNASNAALEQMPATARPQTGAAAVGAAAA